MTIQTVRIAMSLVACCVLTCSSLVTADAQQVTLGVPQQVLSDSFYENFGLGWGFQKQFPGGGGFFFNNGGFGGALPQFGGFDPNAGATFGFGGGGNNGSFNFNFAANQGSNRSITSVTPMVTLLNGGIGSIQSGEIRPFVTGIVPVIGGGGAGGGFSTVNPLTERLQRMQAGEQPGPRHYVQRQPKQPVAPSDDASDAPAASGPPASRAESSDTASASSGSSSSTAQRGDLSVKEIRRQAEEAARADANEVADLIAKAEAAEAEGKLGVARVYFQQVLRRVSGDQAREIAARVKRLK